MASSWISYNELAWTENLFADPSDCEREIGKYVGLIREFADGPVNTILHLGCGAGWHDKFLKGYFRITGVDISAGMLKIARDTNLEIEYLEDDMRSVRLNREFDAVLIPDSIDYMVSADDLKRAIGTAALHLRTGGVLLVVGKTKETFRNNNFVYTGEQGDTHVTLFENNYINPYSPNTYEITVVYLVRRKGKLTTYTEQTTAGLFPEAVWDDVFGKAGLVIQKRNLDGLYDKYLLEKGEYPLTVFIGKKRSSSL